MSFFVLLSSFWIEVRRGVAQVRKSATPQVCNSASPQVRTPQVRTPQVCDSASPQVRTPQLRKHASQNKIKTKNLIMQTISQNIEKSKIEHPEKMPIHTRCLSILYHYIFRGRGYMPSNAPTRKIQRRERRSLGLQSWTEDRSS